MCDDRNGYSGLIAFLAGAAIGAGLGLLFAPQSGKETRKKIKDVSEKVVDDVKEAAEKAIDQIKSFVQGAKEGMKMEIKEEILEESPSPSKKKVTS